jgi:hypothetical protein
MSRIMRIAQIGTRRFALVLICVLAAGCSDRGRDPYRTAATDTAPAEVVASPHAGPSIAPAPLPPPAGLPTVPPPDTKPKFQPEADAPSEEPMQS